jgi:hypothetical protein
MRTYRPAELWIWSANPKSRRGRASWVSWKVVDGDAPVFMCLTRKKRMPLINHSPQSPHRRPGCLAPCQVPRHRAPQAFWEDSDRDDFPQRLETILTETQTPCEQVLKPGKQPVRVYARSLLCRWVIRSIGMTAAAVSQLLGISPSAVTRAAYRGEAIIAADNLTLVEGHNA